MAANERRDSSFELLRIIGMILIVLHHIACHGGFEFDSSELSVSRAWFNLIKAGGKIGVNIFVLISGYFLSSDEKTYPDIRKLFKVWAQLVFYSVGIYSALCICGYLQFNSESFIRSFVPVLSCTWWFASTYFVLYLLHPVINIFLRAADRKRLQSVLILLLFIWSVIPTLTDLEFQGSNLLWFFVLYLVAGYYRKFGLPAKLSCRRSLLLSILSFAFVYGFSLLMLILGKKWPGMAVYSFYFCEQERLPLFLASFFLFVAFSKMKVQNSSLINTLASATFGVYLIHDYSAMRQIIWRDFLNVSAAADSAVLIPYSVFCAFMVFACCVVVDLIRKRLLEYPFMRVVNRYSCGMESSIRLGVQWLEQHFFED